MTVRILVPKDSADLIRLRSEALLAAPTAFASSPGQDRGSDPKLVRASLADAQSTAVFGAFDGAESLCGMVGVFREPKEKLAHKANVYGMYVQADARGRGWGRQLLDAAVEHARSWAGIEQVHLSVSEDAGPARQLYESSGFREWGYEPRALACNGRFYDQHHLVLTFDPEES